MTREEAKQILEDYVKACREDDFFKIETGFTYEKVIEAMDMGAKSLLSHSLPFSLDEAAEKYAKGEGLENALGGWEDMSDAFKAGAEWMAGQGEVLTTETVDELCYDRHNRLPELIEKTRLSADDRVELIVRKI